MKIILAACAALSSGQLMAQTGLPEITMCDGCSVEQKLQLAREKSQGLGFELIGDRSTGEVKGWIVNHIDPAGGIPMGVHPADDQISDAVKRQFAAYSDLYRVQQNTAPIEITVNLASASAAARTNAIVVAAADLPPAFPDSAFDVTEDGAARASLINWMKDTNNWENNLTSQAVLYARMTLLEGRAWYSGMDYQITITANFADGGKVVLRYNSTTQQVEFVEARDSVGNLLTIVSDQPVPVDYSWYDRPEAKNQPDYNRGMQWLNARGIISSGGTVRTGTVIVGGTVQLQEK
ncbi:hypothetical protein [Stenotrophomonas cyclobalanopsidis]|uniref:hypothetical protein n=1 Tax=Stenotrophomonas cyclobalanopsidis TaxID=2771362 RepID=UPI0034612637